MGAPPFGYVQTDESLGATEQEATRKFYDQKAYAFYQKTKDAVRLPTWLKDQLFGNACKGSILLDLGCGYGACYSEVPSCLSYIGVDFSAKLIEIGKVLFPEADLRVGDICNLDSIVTERADYFLASMVFGHVARSNAPKAFSALASVLRDGARGILTTYFSERSYFLTTEDIGIEGEGGLIQGGFDEESLEPFLTACGLQMGEWHYDYQQGIAYVEVHK